MKILGISDSHEAHACLYDSGNILVALAEERFSRVKSDCGYPYKAIEEVLKITNTKPSDIDLVVFAGHNAGLFNTLLKPSALFEVDDWIFQNNNYWKPKLIEKKSLSSLDDYNLFKDKIEGIEENQYYGFVEEIKNKDPSEYTDVLKKYRRLAVTNQIGIKKEKICFVRHEDCHKYYGYYSQVNFKSKCLIFTMEGGGDDSSATLSVVEGNKIIEKYKTNEAMLGRLYRYITLLLGMKPTQHEYKVMGLAPYGSEYHGIKSLNHFRNFNEVVGTEIINKKVYSDVYFSSKEILEGQRFDGIAWGLQRYLEEILNKWVENCVKKYKIKDVIVSGGIAQNIKAMQKLSANKNINSVWCGPISGDGSLAIGAVWAEASRISSESIKGISSIYLGTSISQNDIEKNLTRIENKYRILKKYSSADVAKWISEGLIVARCKGKMEFGQRALGNRSILADPRKFDTVDRINRKIKYRDFWMPFTPTICFEDVDKYIVNQKNIYSPWMTMAYDLNKGISEKLPAIMHPADKTCRPQMLKKEDNPEYYTIIKEFEKITGFPVILNTSFNLHGDAIVENASQAIKTFDNSDLDVLLIENYAIFRS